MKKLSFLFVFMAITVIAVFGEKKPDVSEFTISNRAGSVNGSLAGPQTFNRPVGSGVDLTCSGLGYSLSGVGTAVFYETFEIFSPTGENLVAEVSSPFDSYLLLYCDPFNPNAPLANLRLGDDDDGVGVNAAFLPGDNAWLEPNIKYILVVSSFSNGAGGNFTLSVDGGVVFGSPADRCDGVVSLVGEFNNWGDDGDFNLTQDPVDPDIWTGTIALTNDMNLHNDPDIIEVKFRLNADWAINWGAADFPVGIGVQDGPNIPVPIGLDAPVDEYDIIFNCYTGEYTFINRRFIPISNWALYLGIFLMITFIVIRFRRIV
ncbi:MAG: hypothetical protein R6W71_11250 [Bacteroidales bacterium]